MDEFEIKVKEALELVRPALQNDGGDIEFIKTEGKTVFVKLQGHCAGCMMSAMTLKYGVERMLQSEVDPDIIVENLQEFQEF